MCDEPRRRMIVTGSRRGQRANGTTIPVKSHGEEIADVIRGQTSWVQRPFILFEIA